MWLRPRRGRGGGPETLGRGLTPRCIVRRGPPPSPPLPSPGRDPVATKPPPRPQRLPPPPAAPTSRCPDQGPDVESSPRAGGGGAVHSAPPPPAASLRPQAGLCGAPASCERVSVRRPRRHCTPRPGRAAPRRARAGSPGCTRPAAARELRRRGPGRTGGGPAGSMSAQPR